MQIMRTYMTPEAPSLVTFEDIETLNAAYRSKLLELFDGATGKNDRVLLLTTTNTPEVLEPALLRPGRIDALIPIELPDLGAFTKLIQMQLGEMLAEDVDFEAAFPAFEGYTSAWIVGSAEIVIRGAIARTGKFQGLKISTRDLVVAANSYRPQFEMQNRSANREEELPTLDQALQHMVYNAMEKVADNYSFTTHDDNTDYYEVKSKVEEAIREDVGDIVCEAIDEKLHGAKIVKGDYGQEIKTN
jgi:transitional endoplasmic reticulum ATPase